MKALFSINAVLFIVFFPTSYACQNRIDSLNTKSNFIPKFMLDFSYSNKYLFLNNNSKTAYSNGDILLKLNNDFEINVVGLLPENFKSKRHKLYMGIGMNYSEYLVNRNLFPERKTYSGHFPLIYSYSPDKLEYKLKLVRFQFQIVHYAFYEKIFVFQKIGVAYTSFVKNTKTAFNYTEKYGNSTPNKDSAYVTVSNPDGWYFKDNYTYTNKNDMDIYKDGFNMFYKFGMGVKIKQFTPFAAFEFSNITGKFWSPYFKFQIGINYSILPQ